MYYIFPNNSILVTLSVLHLKAGRFSRHHFIYYIGKTVEYPIRR